jgi:hypothetical protein
MCTAFADERFWWSVTEDGDTDFRISAKVCSCLEVYISINLKRR